MTVRACPQSGLTDDVFDLGALTVPAVVAVAPGGHEHLLLSDGYRRIRIDVVNGSLLSGPVLLEYQLQGMRHIDAQLLSLRRLIALVRTGRFVKTLFPSDPYAARIAKSLRSYDALQAGASQRDIAIALFGADLVEREWAGTSDFLKSRTRRLLRLARTLAAGGWRDLMR